MTKLEITRTKPKDFEEILDTLGGFGRFQTLILVLLLSFEIPASWIAFAPIYIGNQPDFWECDGQAFNSSENICECNGTISASEASAASSIVAEWALVCSSAWVYDAITSIQMFGMLVGNIYSAQFADWYGRKYALLGVSIIMGVGSGVSAVAPNAYVYVVARFLCGAGFSGTLGLSAVFAIEFMPSDWRALSGSVGPYGVATMSLGLLAYLIRPWRSFLWATTIPASLVVLFPFIPESPRWLLNKQKIKEAHKVIKYMARVNGVEPIEFETLKQIAEIEASKSQTSKKKFSYFYFFKSKDLRLTTICLMIIWFAFAIVYFGLSYNIKNVPGDRFWNGFYIGVPDAIGFPAALLVLNRFGRRISVFMSMSLGALFLVILAILQLAMDINSLPMVVLSLSLLGKFGMAMARSSTRCLSSESFPTNIRSMGLGLCGIAASLGGVVAPQLAYLGMMSPSIPFFVFAIISVGGSLCAFLMKETTGQPLQDNTRRKSSRRISISAISAIILPKQSCAA